jgi:hypothetical protein
LNKWKITLRCEAGHEQVLYIDGDEWFARQTASMMDGTNEMYIVDPLKPPYESSWIGHCTYGLQTREDVPSLSPSEARSLGACGERFTATVEPAEDTAA